MDSRQHLARAAAAVLALAGACVVTQLTGVPAARAAVPGLQVVSAVSVGDATSPKTVVATCPIGKRVVGTGVYTDSGERRIVLDDLIPTATTVRATGYEDQAGTSAHWWIRAFAVCADPLPGYEIVTATSTSTSTSNWTAAACSSGKRTVGSGAAITGGSGQVVLDASLTTAAGAYAVAYEDGDGTAANWTVTSYVICASAPAGLETVTTTVPADTNDKSASATCGAGKKPLSLGWDVGTSDPGRVVVDIAMPTATGALVAARASDKAVTGSWSLTTRIICATA
jgi:hypothetical protein